MVTHINRLKAMFNRCKPNLVSRLCSYLRILTLTLSLVDAAFKIQPGSY